MKTILPASFAKYLLLSVFFFTTVHAYSYADDPLPLEIGARAPAFSLRGVDGKTYTLNSFAGAKILAIVFTCNHCPTAQAYEDRLIALTKDYKSKGVAVVAISPNYPEAVALDELGYSDMGDSFEEMKLRAKEKGFNFPYLFDGMTAVASKAYGPAATPHVFIFDQKRALQYSGRFDASEKPGTANAEDVRNAMDELLAGKTVTVNKTKTFGCSIKWKEKSDWALKAPQVWAKEEVLLNLVDAQGLESLLQNKTNKVRLVNVWATWCGPCVNELPDFITINRMYRNREFEFITVSADVPEKRDKALALLRKLQASNTNYLFNSTDKYELIETIDPKWQGALPYTMLIAPGGKIIYRKQGTINPAEMKKKIVDQIGRYY